MDNKDADFSYVTYGMLQKNHEFVDWVRVDLEEEDKVFVQNANANPSLDGDTFKDMDERAFEKLKTQWQEISVSDAGNSSGNATPEESSRSSMMNNINNTSIAGKDFGKKLLASATAKKLTPDSVSYGVFDAFWNPVKFSPRHSNVDVAILMHAASEEGKSGSAISSISSYTNTETEEASYPRKRTYLSETVGTDPATTHSDLTKSKVSDGTLPIVPVRRSNHHQFMIKQSVKFFFAKDSIQFFACFPLRYSPRTIYRFDMVNGGIDRNIFQKRNATKELTSGDETAAAKMNAKLNEISTSFASKVSTTKESILNLKSKKSLDEEKKDGDGSERTTKMSTKLRDMRSKMTPKSFSLRSSFKLKGSWKMKKNSRNNNSDLNDIKSSDCADNETKNSTPVNLGKMKERMVENTTNMKQKMTENTTNMKQKMSENTTNMKQKVSENTANMKQKMSENTANMKQRVTENTATVKQKMSQNTVSMKTSFASKVSATKQSLLKMKTKMKGDSDEPEGSFVEAKTDINTSLTTGDSAFTIDDDEGLLTALTLPSSTPQMLSGTKSSAPAGYVALTIDDVPCRFDDQSYSQLENVLDLLKKHDAKATFFSIASFMENCHESDMIRLLLEGHELGNHGVRDEAMDKKATSVEVFLEALDECNTKITNLQKKANVTTTTTNVEVGVKWFRAPMSKYTKIMEEGLVKRDMHNVMCDAYAACPIVEDGPWIASALSKQIRNGSIAALHMPEKCGFREYCLVALEHLLDDLCNKRNFKVVTVGELQRISEEVKLNNESTPEEIVIVAV